MIHRLLEWYTSDKAQLIKSLELKDRGLSQMIEVARSGKEVRCLYGSKMRKSMLRTPMYPYIACGARAEALAILFFRE